jgi:pyrimidine-nucleoside phosphorylase
VVDDTSLLPRAKNRLDVLSPVAGYVTAMDCEKAGIASLILGGGRSTKEDVIDPAVGIMVHKKIGDKVATGEALCTLHYNGSEHIEKSRVLIEGSYTISAKPLVKARELIHRVIQGSA